MAEQLRVGAIHADPGYYPVFVAEELGYFADSGLTVDFSSPGHGPWIARALLAGEAEIALGGLWRPMTYRGRIGDLVGFAQLNAKCYMWLVGRAKQQQSGIESLLGKSLIIPDGAPSPWIYIRGLLREHNADEQSVKLITGFGAAEALDLFHSGLGDFIALSPGAAEVTASKSGACLTLALSQGGLCPWSVFYSTPEFLDRDHGELAGRFAAAILKALRWVNVNPADAAVDMIRKRFPKIPLEIALEAIEGCRSRGVWAPSVRISETSLTRWQRMVVDSGLTQSALSRPTIFDDRPSTLAGDPAAEA